MENKEEVIDKIDLEAIQEAQENLRRATEGPNAALGALIKLIWKRYNLSPEDTIDVSGKIIRKPNK